MQEVMNTPTDGRESDANAHNEHRPALYGRKVLLLGVVQPVDSGG